MPTLKERIAGGVRRVLEWFYRNVLVARIWWPLRRLAIKWWTPRSFGVYSADGKLYFVEANKFTIDKDGRLLFRRFGRLLAAVNAEKWERVLEGISLKDFSVEE